MHELSITKNILDIAQTHATRAGATRVKSIELVIGDLSSFVDDSIQFYWDSISRGTICEGAKLHFKRIAARLTCLDCGTSYELSGELVDCPRCHSDFVRISGGDEFGLESIEVETSNCVKEVAA